MQDSEFAGRLDFNQYTREINVFDVLHVSPKPPDIKRWMCMLSKRFELQDGHIDTCRNTGFSRCVRYPLEFKRPR